ncbi:MAG: hypothetical protein ACD_76C00014G0002 [uncultured bacterium]|nr:MAG: hypothetical protein ACD_76C00014G0002 [uncultured bacterium]
MHRKEVKYVPVPLEYEGLVVGLLALGFISEIFYFRQEHQMFALVVVIENMESGEKSHFAISHSDKANIYVPNRLLKGEMWDGILNELGVSTESCGGRKKRRRHILAYVDEALLERAEAA